MKIGLYGKPNRNILTSFADGALALGLSPVWQNPAGFSRMETQKFDFCALWGGAGPKSREIITTYEKFGIKTLVFEGGYVGSKTHSIGIGHHYWLPDFKCSPDRIDKFGLKFTKEQKKDGYILVIGQSAEINSNLAKVAQRLVTSHKVVFRPHPSIDFDIEGIEKIGGTLERALSGAFAVVCDTSNVAHHALLKGIPVFCSKNAMYAECANLDVALIDAPHIPSDDTLVDYFSRMTYAVWTEEEIKNGDALKFYISVVKGEEPEPTLFDRPKLKDNIKQIKKVDEKSIKSLKGKYKGQTAYIVGKGPSLKHLTAEDFGGADGGIVITLNEAVQIIQSANLDSRLHIFSMQKDGKPECMVKPNDCIPLVLHENESKGWFPEHPQRYVFDIKKDFGLEDNDVSVIEGNCCSVIAAIEMVKLLGCNKIVFMCFDSYTHDINGYPEDSRLGKLLEIPQRQEHLDAQKIQIPMHTKDIETEFITPEKKKLPFTVITLTGDRPEAFRLCKKYVARQTVQPAQWIVVDDGKKVLPKKDREGFEYYRRRPGKNEPVHTLRLNLLGAMEHVKYDKVVIVEDDDWYREDYFEVSLKYLEMADLVGQRTFYYWNLLQMSYHKVKDTNRPAMCVTAFNRPAFDTVIKVCENSPDFITTEKERARIDKGSVDLFLWSKFKGTKKVYDEGENVCVGIKGVAGREGHTLGHTQADKEYFQLDPEIKVLKRLIGKDVSNYFEET